MITRRLPVMLLVSAALALPGCGGALDTSYGRAGNQSLNGTGVIAALFRGEGHTVRTAIRLTDELAEWADVIVRFAPVSGPPGKDEAQWYLDWMNRHGGRRMIYVVRDYDAEEEYWSAVVDRLSKEGESRYLTRAKRLARQTTQGTSRSPRSSKELANSEEWFAVEAGNGTPSVCKTLEGPWAEGIVPAAAALTRHETLKVEAESVLLAGDGKPLAIEWSRFNGGQVLVVANGTFLLNETLVNRARRPLALRVVRWPGSAPVRVAFVEGPFVLGGPPESPSVFALLWVPPFGWIAAQLLVLGLAAGLARAPRLGRPRPEAPSGEDRPVAHPEALGLLMARTGQAADARAILDSYRRWRYPSHSSRSSPPSLAEGQSKPTPLPESLSNG